MGNNIMGAGRLQVKELLGPNGNTAMTIDTSGRAHIPAIAFKALKHPGGNWTDGGGEGNSVIFNTIFFNQGFTEYDITTDGRIYAPVDGIYRVSYQFLLNSQSSNANTMYTAVMKNHTGTTANASNYQVTTYDYWDGANNDYTRVGATTLVRLTTADYFAVCIHTGSVTWYGGDNASASYSYNQCSCELVGSLN